MRLSLLKLPLQFRTPLPNAELLFGMVRCALEFNFMQFIFIINDLGVRTTSTIRILTVAACLV